MWRSLAIFITAIAYLAPAYAANLAQNNGSEAATGLKMIKNYRANQDPTVVPGLIRSLSQQGAFKDPESSGVYLGFFAGVLGSNPRGAQTLIDRTLPLPFEDQWVVIRAVAYSGLPHWKDLMRGLAARLPHRQFMVEQYLTGKLPTLDQVRLEPYQPTTMEKVKRIFKREDKKNKPRELTFATTPELIDIHWGLYFATGKEAPVVKIVTLLPWSKERDSVDKLTIGSMAKFTLAANATIDVKLLAILKRLSPQQSKTVRPILDEVIEAAEISDTGRIKKEAHAALDELRTKGPGSKRDIAGWGQVGQTVLSLGCIGAAATGQVEFGVPCVVGGALSTAALRYFTAPE